MNDMFIARESNIPHETGCAEPPQDLLDVSNHSLQSDPPAADRLAPPLGKHTGRKEIDNELQDTRKSRNDDLSGLADKYYHGLRKFWR